MCNRLFATKLTPEQLSEIFSYNEISGALIWQKPKGRVTKGTECKSIKRNGYLQVEVGGYGYLVHRVAWAIKTGTWPEMVIDHVDGVKSNNAWSNLRDVTQQVNLTNFKKARVDNKTGLLGVTFLKNRGTYKASITINGKTSYLGAYKSAQDAHDTYISAKRLLHEGNTL